MVTLNPNKSTVLLLSSVAGFIVLEHFGILYYFQRLLSMTVCAILLFLLYRWHLSYPKDKTFFGKMCKLGFAGLCSLMLLCLIDAIIITIASYPYPEFNSLAELHRFEQINNETYSIFISLYWVVAFAVFMTIFTINLCKETIKGYKF